MGPVISSWTCGCPLICPLRAPGGPRRAPSPLSRPSWAQYGHASQTVTTVSRKKQLDAVVVSGQLDKEGGHANQP